MSNESEVSTRMIKGLIAHFWGSRIRPVPPTPGGNTLPDLHMGGMGIRTDIPALWSMGLGAVASTLGEPTGNRRDNAYLPLPPQIRKIYDPLTSLKSIRTHVPGKPSKKSTP